MQQGPVVPNPTSTQADGARDSLSLRTQSPAQQPPATQQATPAAATGDTAPQSSTDNPVATGDTAPQSSTDNPVSATRASSPTLRFPPGLPIISADAPRGEQSTGQSTAHPGPTAPPPASQEHESRVANAPPATARTDVAGGPRASGLPPTAAVPHLSINMSSLVVGPLEAEDQDDQALSKKGKLPVRRAGWPQLHTYAAESSSSVSLQLCSTRWLQPALTFPQGGQRETERSTEETPQSEQVAPPEQGATPEREEAGELAGQEVDAPAANCGLTARAPQKRSPRRSYRFK